MFTVALNKTETETANFINVLPSSAITPNSIVRTAARNEQLEIFRSALCEAFHTVIKMARQKPNIN
jgi:hypothetical protein